MKKLFPLRHWMKVNVIPFLICFSFHSDAQIVCIFCFDQNDSISQNVTNLLVNGGFENSTCNPGQWTDIFCPNATAYNCDVDGWQCTNGGVDTYCSIFDINYSVIVEGLYAVYLGNGWTAQPCDVQSNVLTCLTDDSLCRVIGATNGYPMSDMNYGGSYGVSLQQTVSGLTPGNIYVLEFWAGGEYSAGLFPDPGVFAVDVGFGNTFLRCMPTELFGDIGKRYIIEFNATSTTHTIKFTNWGHLSSCQCSEVVLDDIRLYTLAQLSPSIPACSNLPNPIFNSPNMICPGECVDFTNLSLNATSYQWSFPNANITSSTDVNPTGICYSTSGNYDVQLIAFNTNGTDTLLLPNYITVFPSPLPQSITQSGDTLFAISGSPMYQWYWDGHLIPGATNFNYVATANGNYNVVVTDINGCEVEAGILNVLTSAESSAINTDGQLAIFPNPVSEMLSVIRRGGVIPLSGTADAVVSIYNSMGEKVYTGNYESTTIDCKNFPAGVYYLEVTSKEQILRARFVKQ